MSDKPNVSSDFPGSKRWGKTKGKQQCGREAEGKWQNTETETKGKKRDKKKADEEINEGERNERLLRAAESRQRRWSSNKGTKQREGWDEFERSKKRKRKWREGSTWNTLITSLGEFGKKKKKSGPDRLIIWVTPTATIHREKVHRCILPTDPHSVRLWWHSQPESWDRSGLESSGRTCQC